MSEVILPWTEACLAEDKILKRSGYVHDRVTHATVAHLHCPRYGNVSVPCGCPYHKYDSQPFANYVPWPPQDWPWWKRAAAKVFAKVLPSKWGGKV